MEDFPNHYCNFAAAAPHVTKSIIELYFGNFDDDLIDDDQNDGDDHDDDKNMQLLL